MHILKLYNCLIQLLVKTVSLYNGVVPLLWHPKEFAFVVAAGLPDMVDSAVSLTLAKAFISITGERIIASKQ